MVLVPFLLLLILVHWSLSVFLSGLHVPCPWPLAWTCSVRPKWPFERYKFYLKVRLQQNLRKYITFLRRRHLFLLYLCDFWMGRANCPLFAEHILLTAEHLSHSLPAFLRDDLEQQWGIPPEHHSPGSDPQGVLNLEQFPAIPIPFCLRFREGSTIMHMVPSKDLDPFTSLQGQGVLPGVPKIASPSKVSDVILPSSTTKASAVPPRVLRRNREVESLKADASSFLASPRSIRSKDSDNELPSSFPLVDAAPQVSSSAKVSVGRKEPKSKTTVKEKHDKLLSVTKIQLPMSEDEDEDEDEDIAPPPKHPKTTSSISASLPRRSVPRVSVPK
ncbi:MAG: hypothetical protein NXY57DRAFT_1084487 [Lentinula lateritia]|nr:MAG: hypothetical protein NXY57DRAFT_1084487 [Lentinula lateritia]